MTPHVFALNGVMTEWSWVETMRQCCKFMQLLSRAAWWGCSMLQRLRFLCLYSNSYFVSDNTVRWTSTCFILAIFHKFRKKLTHVGFEKFVAVKQSLLFFYLLCPTHLLTSQAYDKMPSISLIIRINKIQVHTFNKIYLATGSSWAHSGQWTLAGEAGTKDTEKFRSL